ncbi:hypothetical protein BDN72DRAFT_964487 [Pluteus cervinus]|uniref:Uncharacterized protein n=1 Tax=Pluteus cervinus TaxID=181527 RepID=A0ACD3ACD9_9AGAR|nr:hypothetical protein BDN72DRAFT_964487 [Pluteus cervinus]
MLFPPELILEIIYKVVECCTPIELAAALRSCSLVCELWRVCAQPLLYSRFARYKLCYHNSQLIRALLASERTQGYTKCLWIGDNWSTRNGPEEELLFKLLPQLRDLGIWDTGFTKLQASGSLHRFAIASAQITCLQIQCLDDFPVDLFDHWIALKELKIDNSVLDGFSRISGKPANFSQETRVRPHIQTLQIDIFRSREISTLAWLMHPECALDISSLKTLHLGDYLDWMSGDEIRLMREFIAFCSLTVEELLVGVRPGRDFDIELPHILSHVRVLRFQLLESEGDIPETFRTALPRITGFLSIFGPHPDNLQEVWIPGVSLYHEGGKLDDKVLKAYQELAARLVKFKNLRKLWIVYYEEDNKLSEEEVEAGLRQVLSGVYERLNPIFVQIVFQNYGRYAFDNSEIWHYGDILD